MPRVLLLFALVALSGCAASPRPAAVNPLPELEGAVIESRHDADDDLLSAGLGLEGLRQLPPPSSANPTDRELRRRAIWHSWRGISDLRETTMPEALPIVPGREFSAQLRLAADNHAHQVVAQIPDAFDVERPCLLVAPASGSRGVYGAIAVAAPVGLPRGCAIAYTDKGAGTRFEATGATGVYVPHAHSTDNPEARWGEHVLLAARFGLAMLDRAGLRRQPFTPTNTRIVAVGLSNGGGAVLHAAEIDTRGILDAVVAAAPNIQPGWTGARALYDYTTEAALYQPCLLAQPAWSDAPFMTAELRQQGQRRCSLLRSAGLLDANTAAGQSREAHERLRASGWSEGALRLAAQNIAFDLWRAVAVTYASAYGRYGVDSHPCGFSFAAVDAHGRPRPASPLEQQLWRSEGSGIAPTAGVAIIDPNFSGDDAALPGISCLRRLWTEQGPDAERVRTGIEAVRATGRPRTARVTILHGADDALIPPAFTSRPYVDAARAHGIDIDYREVERAQHFDAFLPFPAMTGYTPLLPNVWRALDEQIDPAQPATGSPRRR
jgi:hydroxybutyrate-dimer hydrolase